MQIETSDTPTDSTDTDTTWSAIVLPPPIPGDPPRGTEPATNLSHVLYAIEHGEPAPTDEIATTHMAFAAINFLAGLKPDASEAIRFSEVLSDIESMWHDMQEPE